MGQDVILADDRVAALVSDGSAGTAGTPSANVNTIQGVSGGTPIPATLTSQGYSSRQTLTRCSDTNIYAAGDVIGIGTGAGTTTPGSGVMTFPIGPTAGGVVAILDSLLEIDVTAVPSGMTSFTFHAYSAAPAAPLVDNAAWVLADADRATYLGPIALGAPVDVGGTLFVAQSSINKAIKLTTANLYGYLVTDGAFTPASATVKALTLVSVGL